MKFARPDADAVQSSWIFVTNNSTATVTQLSSATSRLVRVIAVVTPASLGALEGLIAISACHGAVWITSSLGESVTEVDPATGRLIRQVH
jgi:DNA-binding beta-propeller fold protein YncE